MLYIRDKAGQWVAPIAVANTMAYRIFAYEFNKWIEGQ